MSEEDESLSTLNNRIRESLDGIGRDARALLQQYDEAWASADEKRIVNTLVDIASFLMHIGKNSVHNSKVLIQVLQPYADLIETCEHPSHKSHLN